MATKSRTPWWLWPNLLNLDSPILALIWQEQFARIANVDLALGDRLILFCCTWLVYCTDRLLDVINSNTKTETGRHSIHQKKTRCLDRGFNPFSSCSTNLSYHSTKHSGFVGRRYSILINCNSFHSHTLDNCFTNSYMAKGVACWTCILDGMFSSGLVFTT